MTTTSNFIGLVPHHFVFSEIPHKHISREVWDELIEELKEIGCYVDDRLNEVSDNDVWSYVTIETEDDLIATIDMFRNTTQAILRTVNHHNLAWAVDFAEEEYDDCILKVFQVTITSFGEHANQFK